MSTTPGLAPRIRGFAPGRLFGLDVARGLALLGMFAAHVVHTDAEQVYDGRSAILFATVAGVSLGLVSGAPVPADRPRRLGIRLGVALRALALIVIGVALSTWSGAPIAVILDAYGFLFLLLIPVLFVGWRTAVALAIGLAATMPWIVSVLLAATTAGDLDLSWAQGVVEVVAIWLVWGPYPVLVWVVFPLVGLALARADLRRPATRGVAAIVGAVAALVGYGSAFLLPGVDAAAHSGTLAEVLGSTGIAILVIVGCVALGERAGRLGDVLRVVLYPVAAAGGMVLTLYTVHAVLLGRWMLGWTPEGGVAFPGWTLPTLVVGALGIATLWRLLIGSGPLEALLAWLARLVRTGGPARPGPSAAPPDPARPPSG